MAPTLPSDITERDLEMLDFASHGLSNRDIAREHSTTEQVVKNRWRALMDRLGVENRAGAVGMAMRKGWIR